MGQNPSDVRTELEEPHAGVGDEPDALRNKTDVQARGGAYNDEKHAAGGKVGRLKDTAKRNPLGLAIGGAAAGFVAGLLIPSTRLEDKQMGEMSDKVIDAAKDTASDALESGKQVAQQATGSAKEQSQDLASNLQERAQESLAGAPSSN